MGRDDHSLGFAVRAMHSRSLSRFEPGLGKFEVAWEVGWICCEVVTRMSPTNTGVGLWVGIGKILFFSCHTQPLKNLRTVLVIGVDHTQSSVWGRYKGFTPRIGRGCA